MWLSLLVALLKVAGSLSDYLRQKQLINAAQAEVIKANMETALAIISDANKARADAGAKFDATGGVPDDSDPNLRD